MPHPRARPYRQDRRAIAHEKVARRIVDATVRLHARHGTLGTSYAMIADEAQVAPQTVYNHFPERAALLAACMGRAGEKAPPLGPECFESRTEPERRLAALTEAVYAQHAYYRPWMRWAWREAPQVPELAAALDQGRAGLRELLRRAAAPAFGRAVPDAFLDLSTALLDYTGWEALTRGRTSPAAAKLAAGGLAALLDRFSAKGAPR